MEPGGGKSAGRSNGIMLVEALDHDATAL